MARRLIISRKAYLDIERIIRFNNTRNQTDFYSSKITLSLVPLIGMKTDDPDSFVLIWDQFYIFYELAGNTIMILAIYHQKENVDL